MQSKKAKNRPIRRALFTKKGKHPQIWKKMGQGSRVRTMSALTALSRALTHSMLGQQIVSALKALNSPCTPTSVA